MSPQLLIRGFFGLLFSGILAWVVFLRYDAEIGTESEPAQRQKYLPYIPAMTLPLGMLILIAFSLPINGLRATVELMLSVLFSLLLHISFYYLLLMLLMPLLRRTISFRACATLWMVPNYLYLTECGFMAVTPRWIVSVPARLVWVLGGVWCAGFLLVLLWKIAEHLCFRHRLLRRAAPVSEPWILALWQEELEQAGVKKRNYRLMRAPDVTTPLSIGFWRWSIRVVLPERAYDEQSLRLVLRHELIHICREDSANKFFLAFCCAVCWFNPLMWIAMRNSANDLECSCDETVLLQEDAAVRKHYAALLLQEAGSRQGFTTCLSASASAMRSRLKTIVSPGRRACGALAVWAMCFLLFMTAGHTVLAYSGETGRQTIYTSGDLEDDQIRSIWMPDDPYDTVFLCPDEPALHRWLAELPTDRLVQADSDMEGEWSYILLLDTPDGVLGVTLSERMIRLSPLYDGGSQESYYLPEGIDRAQLERLLFPAPSLNLQLTQPQQPYGNDLSAKLQRLQRVSADSVEVLYEDELPEDQLHGRIGHTLPDTAGCDFSWPPAAPVTVEVASMDGKICYTLSQEDMAAPFVFDLPDFAAHYTVNATLRGPDQALYQAQFRFDLGLM